MVERGLEPAVSRTVALLTREIIECVEEDPLKIRTCTRRNIGLPLFWPKAYLAKTGGVHGAGGRVEA